MYNPSKHTNVALLILDGWGLYKKTPHNAIALAHTPYFDSLVTKESFARMQASGVAVGLPDGQIGTSEVNHLTIGAGRILYQSLVRINNAISDGSFEKNKKFHAAFNQVKTNGSVLHLIGLYSSGGVHSHATHFRSLIELAAKQGVPRVQLHLFSDGRDVSPTSGATEINELRHWIKQFGNTRISTISGRYYGMDRDENWGRTNKTYTAITNLHGAPAQSIKALFSTSYRNGVTDEFIEPHIIGSLANHHPVTKSDACIFVNFRADRMRQIVSLFEKEYPHLTTVTMMKYYAKQISPAAFPDQSIRNHLIATLAKHAIEHHHISETEKYAHVTYFFNGRREKPYPYEQRTHLKSYADIPTHDLRPIMRAPEITQAIMSVIDRSHTQKKQQFIVANFANADIVGHSARLAPTIAACETIDTSLQRIIPHALKHNWTVLVTADHGNAEMLRDPLTGKPHTAHTLNPVPFIVSSNKVMHLKHTEGLLTDIAPTILNLMEIDKPDDMIGESLV